MLKGEIIGIIGLVAFTEDQKHIIKDKRESMTVFVEKMADLLSAKADQQETLENVEVSRDEMSIVLETAHEGIFILIASATCCTLSLMPLKTDILFHLYLI